MGFTALLRDLPDQKSSGGQILGNLQNKQSSPAKDERFEALTKFIPTQMLAPYVAALSLTVTNDWNSTTVYVSFIVATPFCLVIFQAAKAALDKTAWPTPGPLIWRAIAATIAFAIWGLSVPTNPWQSTIGGAAVAGFLAITISPILTAIDAIIFRLFNVKS